MKAEEKLDQEVDRLWQQMRYAYEHGGGHAGHLNNAWHTAMRLSKELRRLHDENEAKDALLRQALEAMEQAHDESLDEDHFECRSILSGQIAALRERLGETK